MELWENVPVFLDLELAKTCAEKFDRHILFFFSDAVDGSFMEHCVLIDVDVQKLLNQKFIAVKLMVNDAEELPKKASALIAFPA